MSSFFRSAFNSSSLLNPTRTALLSSRVPNLRQPLQQNLFTTTTAKMGVNVIVHEAGSGAQPKPGQTVTMEYTGYLKDPSKPDQKGNKFDSSVGRGDFKTAIGVGRVIKGWDEGVTQMKLGEKATLDISSDYGYGARGFPGIIPANSDLIFDVHLKKIE